MDTPVPPVRIPEHECWLLLREAMVGRLAVVVDDAPELFPVNHVVDHGTLVFRTAEGTKLAAAVGHQVAYEVDGFDPGDGEAWSVVVHGVAREVRELHDVLDALQLPLVPWHADPKPRLVRIEPTSVTGRRFHTAAGGAGEATLLV
jgi:nitroimidazol reductase NimA-like FMN-containing flavoprotein (pyridoxamine 5'-phosphate oxidase superfamily)